VGERFFTHEQGNRSLNYEGSQKNNRRERSIALLKNSKGGKRWTRLGKEGAKKKNSDKKQSEVRGFPGHKKPVFPCMGDVEGPTRPWV